MVVKSELKECRTPPNTTSNSESPRQEELVSANKPDLSALLKLLDEWMHGDETEQRETFELLRRWLDEGRPKGYKFFS